MNQRIALPEPVAKIYAAVAELERLFPGRKFTPDGHLVGSIGEVIAAESLGLRLYPMSKSGHDGIDDKGVQVQIKMTGGTQIAMTSTCERLVVLRVVSAQEAEVVYDGPGDPVWTAAGKMGKNGQRKVPLARLRQVAGKLASP